MRKPSLQARFGRGGRQTRFMLSRNVTVGDESGFGAGKGGEESKYNTRIMRKLVRNTTADRFGRIRKHKTRRSGTRRRRGEVFSRFEALFLTCSFFFFGFPDKEKNE